MMLADRIKIADNGRLVLPKAVREAVGILGEARLAVRVENGEITLTPVAVNVARAQALYAKHAKIDTSSDDFIAARERD
jgi:AbrB family looped-hinge helix DNA binding protein